MPADADGGHDTDATDTQTEPDATETCGTQTACSLGSAGSASEAPMSSMSPSLTASNAEPDAPDSSQSGSGGDDPTDDDASDNSEPAPSDDAPSATEDTSEATSDSDDDIAAGGAGDTDMGTGGAGPGADEGIVIDGRSVTVNGVSLQLRGVNWNPVPKGATHPEGLDYEGFADQDIALMKAAGINAVRTYERLENREVLDKLYAAGIYVFSTVYGWWQDDPSVVVERVNAVKDHPAILAWVLGNEWNYNHLYGNENLSLEQTRDQINEAAALIKVEDPDHPIASIYGEVNGLDAMVAAMPDIDVWGVNVYRGIEFGDLFSSYESISDKPLFLGEYGADAYNADLDAYDPDSQGEAVRVLTQTLLDNSVLDSGVAWGGFVFEWADEWWKVNGGDASVQDSGGTAPGGGPHPDGVFNEEYWGIVDIDRNPRPAYDALVELYAQ